MNARPPSLKRALIVKPMLIQFATLTMMLSVILLVFMRMSSNVAYTEETITGVIAQSIVRHADGRMTLRPTPELARLATTPIKEKRVAGLMAAGMAPDAFEEAIGEPKTFVRSACSLPGMGANGAVALRVGPLVPTNFNDHHATDTATSVHTANVTNRESHLPAMPDYHSAQITGPNAGIQAIGPQQGT